ncbi:unnamed protein product [Meloidogyne enterolobii]|uniref:Uncharacterized protein n=1 Tax=Meloidogyne enterolobii TaxID=390850 RepID=A0ACB1AR26_MELEN
MGLINWSRVIKFVFTPTFYFNELTFSSKSLMFLIYFLTTFSYFNELSFSNKSLSFLLFLNSTLFFSAETLFSYLFFTTPFLNSLAFLSMIAADKTKSNW